jgi:hypothetical protein
LRVVERSGKDCPDKIWEARPKECEGSVFDLIVWLGLPLAPLATAAWSIGAVVMLIRHRHR